MELNLKTIFFLALLNLIKYSHGQGPFPRGVPVSCGSVHEVVPRLQYGISSSMLLNLKTGGDTLSTIGIGRYDHLRRKQLQGGLLTPPTTPPPTGGSDDLPLSTSDFQTMSENGEVLAKLSPPSPYTTFLSRNSITPPPGSAAPYPFNMMMSRLQAHNDGENNPRENSIFDVKPAPDGEEAVFPDISETLYGVGPPSSTPPESELYLSDMFKDDKILNKFPPTNAPSPPTPYPIYGKVATGSRERFDITGILATYRPTTYSTKRPAPSVLQKLEIKIDPTNNGNPIISKTPETGSDPFDSSFFQKFNNPVSKFQDIYASTKFDPRAAANRPLPDYIQSLIEARKKEKPLLASSPTSSNSNDAPSSENKPLANPHDILQSLGPEKLEQLRQILNSAAGPYGSPAQAGSGSDLIRTISDQKSRFRSKRSPSSSQEDNAAAETTVSSSTVAPEGIKCTTTFNKAGNCQRLIVKVQHWVDQAQDCEQEYLLIQDDQLTERLCGPYQKSRQISLTGSSVTVEHFLKSGIGKISFSGVVECESS